MCKRTARWAWWIRQDAPWVNGSELANSIFSRCVPHALGGFRLAGTTSRSQVHPSTSCLAPVESYCRPGSRWNMFTCYWRGWGREVVNCSLHVPPRGPRGESLQPVLGADAGVWRQDDVQMRQRSVNLVCELRRQRCESKQSMLHTGMGIIASLSPAPSNGPRRTWETFRVVRDSSFLWFSKCVSNMNKPFCI